MNITEFDEIRPYNDEELSGVFEELIADPAFQKVVAGVIPDVPFEMLAQRCVPVERNWNFRKPLLRFAMETCRRLYGWYFIGSYGYSGQEQSIHLHLESP